MGSYSIDWDQLRIGYNSLFQTTHETVREMVLELYGDTGSTEKSAEILGVSRPTFANKLRAFRPLNGRGGKNHLGVKKELFMYISIERMRNMTKKEIMKECCISEVYANMLIKEYNRSFKKEPKESKSYVKKSRA